MKDLTLFQTLSIEVMTLRKDINHLRVKIEARGRTEAELKQEYNTLNTQFRAVKKMVSTQLLMGWKRAKIDLWEWSVLDSECTRLSEEIDNVWSKLFDAF